MSVKKVYLSGPITDSSYETVTGWRETVKNRLEASWGRSQIEVFSPLRNKEYLKDNASISGHEQLGHVLSSQRGIYARDYFDTINCDVLFVNLLNAKIVSIGTMFEMAWASAKRTPIVLLMEAEKNIHEHFFVREAADFRVDDMDTAIHITEAILFPH